MSKSLWLVLGAGLGALAVVLLSDRHSRPQAPELSGGFQRGTRRLSLTQASSSGAHMVPYAWIADGRNRLN